MQDRNNAQSNKNPPASKEQKSKDTAEQRTRTPGQSDREQKRSGRR